MKLKKLFSTLVLTAVMMFALVVTSYAANVSYSVSPSEGTTLKPGDIIRVHSEIDDKTIGFTSAVVTLTDADTGAVLDKNTHNILDKTLGNNPLNTDVRVPATASAKRVKATFEGASSKGEKYTKSFVFQMEINNVLNITASKPSGSTLGAGEAVVFTVTSQNSHIGTRDFKLDLYNDATGALIETKTATAKGELGANPLTYTKKMPTEPGTYRVEIWAKDIIGTTATKTFIYIIPGAGKAESDIEDKDDEGDREDYYEGYINNSLEGLAIDLWLIKDTRFYELEEDEIPFVAYYYNFDKKDAKNVTIEVEVPDGFNVIDKSTEYGTVKVKSDVITYDIGTVPSKELRKVYFTLRAIDDDVCEEATNVCAVILKDDDEEDQSTQRIWIYEEDGKGSHTAYVTGYPDLTFRADNNITREEVAAIMARAFNHTVINTTKSFSDVKKTSWSYNYIMACTTKGIITGYTNNTFKPFNNITRAELYAMTYRAMDIPTDEKALFVPKAYKNSEDWEKNYIAGLIRLKMMDEMKDKDADENASRAEVVYLVNGVQFRNPSKMLDVEYTDLSSRHWCAKDIAAASCNYSFKRGEDGKEIVTKK